MPILIFGKAGLSFYWALQPSWYHAKKKKKKITSRKQQERKSCLLGMCYLSLCSTHILRACDLCTVKFPFFPQRIRCGDHILFPFMALLVPFIRGIACKYFLVCLCCIFILIFYLSTSSGHTPPKSRDFSSLWPC